MERIKLTKGQYAIVDKEDLAELSKYRWIAIPSGFGGFYASRASRKQESYSKHLKVGSALYMHRTLLEAPRGITVDHINHDTLDNRRSNIRLATYGENLRNRNVLKANKSGFTGVSRHKLSGKWRAIISLNGKQMSLGYFQEKDQAIAARAKAVLEHYKGFSFTH